MTVLGFGFLLLAGIAGGLAGSVAGLASVATFPALLAIGLPPVTANVTNTMALVFSSIGSLLGSRPELRGQSGRLRALAPAAVLGGIAGAALLLTTPAESFQQLVPILLGAASLTILIPRRAVAPGAAEPVLGRRAAIGQGLGIFAVAIYGGYFGAAAGVVLLALLLHTTRATLPRANAAKNAVLGMANGVAALIFAVLAPVAWAAVIPVGLGCLIGARIGPIVVRRTPAVLIRVLVGVAGLVVAIRLGIQAYG